MSHRIMVHLDVGDLETLQFNGIIMVDRRGFYGEMVRHQWKKDFGEDVDH